MRTVLSKAPLYSSPGPNAKQTHCIWLVEGLMLNFIYNSDRTAIPGIFGKRANSSRKVNIQSWEKSLTQRRKERDGPCRTGTTNTTNTTNTPRISRIASLAYAASVFLQM